MVHYAKSPDSSGHQETLFEHEMKVARLAEMFAQEFNAQRPAWWCGLLHDFGKCSERFQKLLIGLDSGVDHAICGAALIWIMFNRKVPVQFRPIVEAISAHHDGLKPYEELAEALAQNVNEGAEVSINAGRSSALAGMAQYKAAFEAFKAEVPDAARLSRKALGELDCALNGDIGYMLYARMLLSCLVDGDYTASSGKEQASRPLEPEKLLDKLYKYGSKLRQSSSADAQLNAVRDQLFEACGAAAEQDGGLFTLTAPTGTGKTLALLYFALRHCIHAGKRRIIVVLPFLTLTEQSAKVYANIAPEILQDHSQSKLDEDAREHAAKWDEPFIITTSVRFFESLFAHRPTDCRKLHNIAGSVVLFDEAQSLPADLTVSTLKSVNELCRRYNCTVVLSTATQPDFGSIPGLTDWRPREILPGSAPMYRALSRNSVSWRMNGLVMQPTQLDAIAREMAAQTSACAIVNLRAHARKLFGLLKELCPEDEVFLLSTDLCPKHRTAQIAAIAHRQSSSLPCRVVATQCIEAGVDLDFGAMYRALAPLEAIMQAAGRCNRNGRLPDGGRVVVFEPDEDRLYPDNWYNAAAEVVKVMLSDAEVDIDNPEHIREYYSRLFDGQRERRALSRAIEVHDYASVDSEYKLISSRGYKVLVPYDKELYDRLRESALAQGIDAHWLREAAPITVGTFAPLPSGGLPVENVKYRARRGMPAAPSDVYVLNRGSEKCYNSDTGLLLERVNLIF